jgi:alanine racemase
MYGLEGEDTEAVVAREADAVREQQQMEWLAAAVLQHGGEKQLDCVFIWRSDTGMELGKALRLEKSSRRALHRLKRARLQFEGVLTHFASPEEAGSSQTLLQRAQV